MVDYPDGTLPIVVIGSVTVTGTVSITGTVTVAGTVSISGTVTVSGDVTVTGAVTISTITADNIIIDKLTQTAYLGRSVTLSNDNSVTTPTAPPNSTTGSYKGKFFPRGCRGWLESLSIYCKRTGSGTITLSYAPNIGMGAIGSVTITPDSSWNWKSGNARIMWNYDSMHIWISACSADVSWGYDTETANEWTTSSDNGVSWSMTADQRLYLRANIMGGSIGDVPVSGTLNIIEIPSKVSTRQLVQLTDIAAETYNYDTEQSGTGELLYIIFGVFDATGKDYLAPSVICDGLEMMPALSAMDDWSRSVTTTTPKITIGTWSDATETYILIVTIPFVFKRSLKVGFYNYSEDTAYTGAAGYIYKKIS